MFRYCVVTPPYDCVVPVLDDGSGPVETMCDVIEIDASSARDAVALGVREMLRGSWREFKWCRDQRSSGLSPYAGVRAVLTQTDTRRES